MIVEVFVASVSSVLVDVAVNQLVKTVRKHVFRQTTQTNKFANKHGNAQKMFFVQLLSTFPQSTSHTLIEKGLQSLHENGSKCHISSINRNYSFFQSFDQLRVDGEIAVLLGNFLNESLCQDDRMAFVAGVGPEFFHKILEVLFGNSVEDEGDLRVSFLQYGALFFYHFTGSGSLYQLVSHHTSGQIDILSKYNEHFILGSLVSELEILVCAALLSRLATEVGILSCIVVFLSFPALLSAVIIRRQLSSFLQAHLPFADYFSLPYYLVANFAHHVLLAKSLDEPRESYVVHFASYGLNSLLDWLFLLTFNTLMPFIIINLSECNLLQQVLVVDIADLRVESQHLRLESVDRYGELQKCFQFCKQRRVLDSTIQIHSRNIGEFLFQVLYRLMLCPFGVVFLFGIH